MFSTRKLLEIQKVRISIIQYFMRVVQVKTLDLDN